MIRRRSTVPPGLSLALADRLTGIHRSADEIRAIQAQVAYDEWLESDDRPEAELAALRVTYAEALAAKVCEDGIDWARVRADVQAATAARWQRTIAQAEHWGEFYQAHRRLAAVPDTFEPRGAAKSPDEKGSHDHH